MIPEGMVAWRGSDSAGPKDWDGGPVYLIDGSMWPFTDVVTWDFCGDRSVAAYTPKAASHINMNDVTNNILQWARDRNLIDGSTAQAQTVKLLEEAGELAGGVCRGNTDVIADSIGDCVVVLVILAAQCGLDFGECVEGAYNEIKDRRGKMVDGMFVKESDEPSPPDPRTYLGLPIAP